MTVRTTVRINLNVAGEISQEAVLRGVRAATIEAKTLTIDKLSQPGRGRTYERGTISHRASAPGDPPAPDTGRLRQSVQSEVFSTPEGALGVVSVNASYAEALELGTEKIAPRPFISRVIADNGERLQAVFARFARVT
jgi:hypothetical protein